MFYLVAKSLWDRLSLAVDKGLDATGQLATEVLVLVSDDSLFAVQVIPELNVPCIALNPHPALVCQNSPALTAPGPVCHRLLLIVHLRVWWDRLGCLWFENSNSVTCLSVIGQSGLACMFEGSGYGSQPVW